MRHFSRNFPILRASEIEGSGIILIEIATTAACCYIGGEIAASSVNRGFFSNGTTYVMANESIVVFAAAAAVTRNTVTFVIASGIGQPTKNPMGVLVNICVIFI